MQQEQLSLPLTVRLDPEHTDEIIGGGLKRALKRDPELQELVIGLMLRAMERHEAAQRELTKPAMAEELGVSLRTFERHLRKVPPSADLIVQRGKRVFFRVAKTKAWWEATYC